MPLYRPVELQERRRLQKSMLNNAFSSIAVATVTSFAATALVMFTAMPLLGIFALLFLPALFALYKAARVVLDSSHAAGIKRQAQMRQERDENAEHQQEQEHKLRHHVTPYIDDYKPVIHSPVQTFDAEPSYIHAAQTTQHRTTRSYPVDPYSVVVPKPIRYAAPDRLQSPPPLRQGFSNGSVHGKAPLTVSAPVPVRPIPKQAQTLLPANVQRELNTVVKEPRLKTTPQQPKPVVDVDIATQIPQRDEAAVKRRMSSIGVLEKKIQEQQREQAGKPHSLEGEIIETLNTLKKTEPTPTSETTPLSPLEKMPVLRSTSAATLQAAKEATSLTAPTEIDESEHTTAVVTTAKKIPEALVDRVIIAKPSSLISITGNIAPQAQQVTSTATPEPLDQDNMLEAPTVFHIQVKEVLLTQIVRQPSLPEPLEWQKKDFTEHFETSVLSPAPVHEIIVKPSISPKPPKEIIWGEQIVSEEQASKAQPFFSPKKRVTFVLEKNQIYEYVPTERPPLPPKPSFLDFSNLPAPDAELLEGAETDLPPSPTSHPSAIADSILKKRQSVDSDDEDERDLERSKQHTQENQENNADRLTAEATTYSPTKPLPFSAELLAKAKQRLLPPKPLQLPTSPTKKLGEERSGEVEPLQLPTTPSKESDTILGSMLNSPIARSMLDRTFNFGDQKIQEQEVDGGSWDEEAPSTDLLETSTEPGARTPTVDKSLS